MAPHALKFSALAASALMAAPVVEAWGGVFDVRDYGAVGDGATLDTAAVRKTLAAAADAGGGEILFPAGYSFLTRAFNISSNLVLDVQGRVVFSDDPSEDWPVIAGFQWFGPTSNVQFQPCIFGWEVSNITVTGGGEINGNGTKWWPCAIDPSVAPCFGTPRPPALFMPHGGSFLTIHNITFRDAPMWNLRPAFFDYVHIYNTSIFAPSSSEKVNPSHNTDGIDPDCSRHVLVEDVTISVGDDIFALKAGIDWWGRTYGRPSYNLTFRNIVGGAGHGISVGSEMSAGISDVLFDNVSLDGTGTGPRIKTQRGRGGYVKNVTFANFVLKNVQEAIQVTEYYSSTIPPQNASGTPHFANITIRNLTASAYQPGKSIGIYTAGLPESIITGLVLEDVDLGSPATLIANCSYTVGTCIGTVAPRCPPCLTPA